jgi:hypothetical protein
MVTTRDDWKPPERPSTGSGAAAFVVSRFSRLARVHAVLVASDALVAVALAGSLFFSIPTGEARGRVALYLLLTMAPFAIVAPIIGPALDRLRGGPRWVIMVTAAGRALVCAFMVGDIDGLLLFPEAFVYLVLTKTYAVAKSALVPSLVRADEELVEANSKLQLLAGVVGAVAAVPGLVLNRWVGPEATLVMAAVLAAIGIVVALRLPNEPLETEPESAGARAELQRTGIVLGGAAMGVLRGIVGFLTFLIAFDLRGGGDDGPIPIGLALGRAVRVAAGHEAGGTGSAVDAPTWHFGLVVAMAVLGAIVGSVLAPVVRRAITEERMLQAALASTIVVGIVAAARGGVFGAALLSLAVGIASTAGKQAFDAIVQRDAPDAARGVSFARFEARFQLIWVIGGFLPVVVPIPARLGFLVVAGAAGFALFSYLAGLNATRQAARTRGQPSASGRSIRASQRPGASTSGGVGSSRSDRHNRSSASQPERSTTPSTNRVPRS